MSGATSLADYGCFKIKIWRIHKPTQNVSFFSLLESASHLLKCSEPK